MPLRSDKLSMDIEPDCSDVRWHTHKASLCQSDGLPIHPFCDREEPVAASGKGRHE